MIRVGQNHIYTVNIRCFWQENHQIYGQIWCIYTVLANPTYDANYLSHAACAYPIKIGVQSISYDYLCYIQTTLLLPALTSSGWASRTRIRTNYTGSEHHSPRYIRKRSHFGTGYRGTPPPKRIRK